MKHTMYYQVGRMVLNRNTALIGFASANAMSEDDVAEQLGRRQLVVRFHRERQDVRRLVLAPPSGVQRADLFVRGEFDRHFEVAADQRSKFAVFDRGVNPGFRKRFPIETTVPFLRDVGVDEDHWSGPS